MDEDRKRTLLIDKIRARQKLDNKWGKFDFILAQLFVWLAILASFLTAILTAADQVQEKLVLALLTAIPGTVIVIEKSFSFARRARWHWEMIARLEQFSNQLEFECSKVEEVSKRLGEFRFDMEKKFPDMSEH